MKKLIALFSSLAVSITLSAQTETFESYSPGFSNNDIFTGFGTAYSEAYVTDTEGVDGTNGFFFISNWANGTFFGGIKNLNNADLTAVTSISLDARYVENQGTIVADTQLRIGILGENGDIWESANMALTSDYSTLTFTLSEMSKAANHTGSDSLADALASAADYRLIYSNAGISGVQDLHIDNISFVPEPSTYALLVGILALGLVGIKRSIRART